MLGTKNNFKTEFQKLYLFEWYVGHTYVYQIPKDLVNKVIFATSLAVCFTIMIVISLLPVVSADLTENYCISNPGVRQAPSGLRCLEQPEVGQHIQINFLDDGICHADVLDVKERIMSVTILGKTTDDFPTCSFISNSPGAFAYTVNVRNEIVP